MVVLAEGLEGRVPGVEDFTGCQAGAAALRPLSGPRQIGRTMRRGRRSPDGRAGPRIPPPPHPPSVVDGHRGRAAVPVLWPIVETGLSTHTGPRLKEGGYGTAPGYVPEQAESHDPTLPPVSV
jgi:hypothetical protein